MSQLLADERKARLTPAPESVRPELLLHALAQLPDDIMFEVSCDDGERQTLEVLARAYGIEPRAVFRSSGSAPPAATTDIAELTSMAALVEQFWGPADPSTSSEKDNEPLRRRRIGLVTNLPAPYRIPLFNKMAQRLEEVDADFRLFFLGEGSRHRSWMRSDEKRAFAHEFVHSVELPLRSRRPHLPIGLARRLRAFRADVVLSSGFSPLVSGRVAAISRSNGSVFGLWSGEHASMSTAQDPVRRALRRGLVASADFAIAYGHAAAGYLKRLRPSLPLVYGRNTSAVASASRRRSSSELVEILAVGDLASPRKGVDVVIRALAHRPKLACRLTVIGGGHLMPDLQELAKDDRRVRFLGPQPHARVLTSYAEADVFVFPSRADVFGLALVEAMGSGLAPITSTPPGAVADLCAHEHNALVVPTHEPEAWADSLARVVGDTDLRQVLGANARRTVSQRWTLDHATEAMLAGLRLGVLSAGNSSK